MNQTWTETDLAYLAGIIDGEGCLAISTGRGHEGCQLNVLHTDARLIDWLMAHFGGRVYTRHAHPAPGHKENWTWTLLGQDLEDVLTAVLPYLVLKPEQTRLLLHFRATVTRVKQTPYPPLTPEVRAQRALLRTQLHALNRKGAAEG